MSGKKFHKISFKFRLLLLLLAVTPVIVYWFLSYSAVQNITVAGIQLVQHVAQEGAKSVAMVLEKGISDTKLYSRLVEPRIALYFGRYNTSQQLFNSIVSMNTPYKSVVLFDKNGKAVFSNMLPLKRGEEFFDDLSPLDRHISEWLSKLNDGYDSVATLVALESERVDHVQIVSRITVENQETIGFIGVLIPISYLEQTLSDMATVLEYPSTASYLLNSTGSVLSDSGVDAHKRDGTASEDVIRHCSDVPNQLTGGAFLKACVAVNSSDLSEFRRSQLERLLVILALTITVVAMAAVFVVGHLLKPVNRLLEVTSSYIGSGSDSGVAEIKNTDEFGILSGHFDKMIKAIDDYKIKVLESAHLAAIGRSTSMIAHDIRKPLAGVKMLLATLADMKNDPARLKKAMAEVDQSIVRTNSMLDEIMDFSKDATVLKLGDHNPISIISSALGDALRSHPGADVRMEYEFDHQYMPVHADSTRLTRVLVNIIDNALGAMTPKGDEKQAASGILHFRTYAKRSDGKNYIGIAVADNGSGIPDDVLPKIFDPFFTHGKKGGTGLGLAICRKIIEMHGGRIEARSRPARLASRVELSTPNIGPGFRSARVAGGGAEFAIELPAGDGRVGMDDSELIHDSKELQTFREEEAVRVSEGDTANTAAFMRINKERGRESYLLIVDDEPLFRETVRSLLNNISQVKDYVKVVESGSAEEALNLFTAREFDYVIADIDLGRGRMNGYELARRILEKCKHTCVLIHSNKRRDEMDKDIREIDSPRFMGFLPKPMKSSELLQFLAEKSFETVQTDEPAGKRKALVLNDDDSFLVTMRILLKKHGISVTGVTNVEKAIEKFKSSKVDIILSDINLGDNEQNGYEFLKHVRGQDKDVPFYMVSGYSAKEEGPKAKTLGATGYLQLPFEDEQLREILQ